MDACLEDPSAFIKREKDTLEFLSSKHSKRGLSEIAQAANQARYSICVATGASVYFSWGIMLNNHYLTVHVGGLVECSEDNINNISYFMALTEENDNGHQKKHTVLRKYHFDYTAPGNERNTHHPMFHLQFPGKLSLHMPVNEYDIAYLSPHLSEPRIFYLPMSLALVLHTAFSEFRYSDTESIRKDAGWHSHVKKSQRALWLPYFKKCHDHIEGGKILLDEAYLPPTP